MNLLFIAPKFFDYENKIIKELTPYFENIIFKTEIPFQSSTIYYALKRFSKKLAERAIRNYNIKLTTTVLKENIKVIFIIRGVGLDDNFLNSIKKNNPNIKIFHYQWDSFSIVPNAKLIAKYADYNYSFDLNDVRNDNRFKHLPLFSLIKGVQINESSVIDFTFIGTYHSDRILISNKIKEYCKINNFDYFSYLYMPFHSFIRNRLQKNKIKFSDIKIRKLSYKKYSKILASSKIIVDSPYETQFGATMRTIESLSLLKKVISTNKFLKNESFYSENNILIIDKNKNIDLKEFFMKEFDNSKKDEILNVNEWLKKINII